ncbi:MAG: hypothetical protein M3Z00_02920 [Actinomycetota bacterium]|nr:hypothetical protein [Actinomycetota bacterium]
MTTTASPDDTSTGSPWSNDRKPTSVRTKVGIALAVVSIGCTLTSVIIRGQQAHERSQDNGWQQCINDEQSRIDSDGNGAGLLSPADLCRIEYPSHP